MELDRDQNLFPNIIHLPAELLVQIFKYVSRYEEIDVIRQVCERFNSVGEIILKDAFFDIRVCTIYSYKIYYFLTIKLHNKTNLYSKYMLQYYKFNKQILI